MFILLFYNVFIFRAILLFIIFISYIYVYYMYVLCFYLSDKNNSLTNQLLDYIGDILYIIFNR